MYEDKTKVKKKKRGSYITGYGIEELDDRIVTD